MAPERRPRNDFCWEESATALSLRLSVRRSAVAVDAIFVGLAILPAPLARLALDPLPACPELDLLTAKVWADGVRTAVAEALGIAGDSMLAVVCVVGELTTDRRGRTRLESGLLRDGCLTSETRRLAECVNVADEAVGAETSDFERYVSADRRRMSADCARGADDSERVTSRRCPWSDSPKAGRWVLEVTGRANELGDPSDSTDSTKEADWTGPARCEEAGDNGWLWLTGALRCTARSAEASVKRRSVSIREAANSARLEETATF